MYLSQKIMQARKHWRIMQVRGWTLPEVNVDLGLIGWQDWKALGKLWMGGAPYMWVQGGPKVYLHILSSIQVSFSPPHPSPLLSLSFYAQRICLRDTHSFRFRNRHRILWGRGFSSYNIFKIYFFNFFFKQSLFLVRHDDYDYRDLDTLLPPLLR